MEAQEVLNEALNAIGPLEKEKGGGSTNAEARCEFELDYTSYASYSGEYTCITRKKYM